MTGTPKAIYHPRWPGVTCQAAEQRGIIGRELLLIDLADDDCTSRGQHHKFHLAPEQSWDLWRAAPSALLGRSPPFDPGNAIGECEAHILWDEQAPLPCCNTPCKASGSSSVQVRRTTFAWNSDICSTPFFSSISSLSNNLFTSTPTFVYKHPHFCQHPPNVCLPTVFYAERSAFFTPLLHTPVAKISIYCKNITV